MEQQHIDDEHVQYEHKHFHRHEHAHKHHHSHHGVQSIDYYAYHSAMRDFNPSFKMLFGLLTLVLCIALNSFAVSLFILLTTAGITIIMGRLSFRNYLSVMAIPIVFLLMSSLAIALEVGRMPVGNTYISLHFFYISVTKEGAYRAALISAKALGAVSAMFMITLSTPAGELITVLRRWHVPKLLIELMNMIYRFIFILSDIQSRMHIAAQSRLGYVDYKTSLYSFSQTLGNLLVLSLKKSNAYYDALESRGYDGELLFYEEEKPWKVWQPVAAAVYFLVICGIRLL